MAAPSFGLTPGLAFGSNPQTTQQQQQSGFGFSSTPATSAPTFGFGTSATTATPQTGGLTFGVTPQPVAQTGTGFGLGTPPQTTQQSVFGQTSGGSFSFGTPSGTGTTTTTQPTLSFGLQTTTAAAPTTQTGFSFGTPSTSAVTSSPSTLSFNMPTTSTPSLNFNTPSTQTPGFVSTTTSTSSLFSTTKPVFGLAPPTTSSLFGPKPPVTTLSSGGNLGGEVSTPSLIKAVKDNPVPPEMMQLIDNFKTTIKQQKNYSSEIARSSVKPLQKTSEDIESVKHLLAKLERAVNLNKSMNNKLKADTMRCVTDCEMAQRTMEISPGFQSDNMAPLDYFTLLAERFQEQVILLRIEIENTEKHIHSALDPTALSPQELNDSMKRLHECFVALAGRLQLVHSSMSTLKQNHLEIRRKKTNDFIDIFDRKQAVSKQKVDVSTPGGLLTANSLYSSMAALVQSRIAPDQQNSSFGLTGGFQNFALLQQPNIASTPTTAGNVQLKSPPGSKRGKR